MMLTLISVLSVTLKMFVSSNETEMRTNLLVQTLLTDEVPCCTFQGSKKSFRLLVAFSSTGQKLRSYTKDQFIVLFVIDLYRTIDYENSVSNSKT